MRRIGEIICHRSQCSAHMNNRSIGAISVLDSGKTAE
jgi:hypothetical protein